MVIIKQSLMQAMITSATFKIETEKILVSDEAAITTITLSLINGEVFPISGFPRALLAKKNTKGTLACSLYRGHQRLTFPVDSVLSVY